MNTRLFRLPPLIVQLFMLSLIFIAPLRAQSPSQGILGTTPAEWPGVHFDIARIVRLDAEHILVAIKLRGDASAMNPTLISSDNHHIEDVPDEIEPYTLAPATLTDQQTGKVYPAEGSVPSSPYWGRPAIVINIRPNTWIQLAVKFKAPPPLPPGRDGRPQRQMVTFLLPKAKAPIKDVMLPQLEVKP